MKLIKIYKCFCDETRLRILNLLLRSPLCVCHLEKKYHKSLFIGITLFSNRAFSKHAFSVKHFFSPYC